MTIVHVEIPAQPYDVLVESGVRTRILPFVEQLSGVGRLVVIADRQVADLHGDTLRAALPRHHLFLTVPPGDASKSFASAVRLYDQLADARIERSDVILAFGGGMVGDLAGFVAATWLRGIRFIQVPTTLEAAVDASVGGKTAVNHPAGKNLIGAFHQPIAVFIDTDFLKTLSDRDFSAGLAESIKHGVIRDEEFFIWQETRADAILRREPEVVERLIAVNCRIKAEVVAADERETGLRAVLNHGHTIGHAIEHLFEYELRHGECVALGMLVENDLARGRGVLEAAVAARIADLIRALGLPAALPRTVAPADLISRTRMDKKVRGGAVRYVLATSLGSTTYVADLREAEIEAALAAVQPVTD
ncbi:MAG: 3-dehydroquinate synthase [Planctomycetes bacterium]|nr:3-dehydroquinate synthase [Planctomycetota bacterium]